MKINLNKIIPGGADIVKAFKYGFVLALLMFTSIFGENLKAFMIGSTLEPSNKIEKFEDRIRDLEFARIASDTSIQSTNANTELIRQMQIVMERLMTRAEALDADFREMRDREYARLTKE